jgi:hypothetical protein
VQACATCGDISSDHRYYYNDSTSSAHLVALGLHYNAVLCVIVPPGFAIFS